MLLNKVFDVLCSVKDEGFNQEFLIIDDAGASDTEEPEPGNKDEKPLEVGGKYQSIQSLSLSR